MLSINFVAVIVAAIVAFIVGFLMHGPIGGKLWMKLANIVPTGKEKFSDMVPQMLWNLFANIIIATVVYVVLGLAFSIVPGTILSVTISVIFTLWIFTVAGSSMDVIWMGKSKKLWMFECFSSLLVIASMGAVIAAWF